MRFVKFEENKKMDFTPNGNKILLIISEKIRLTIHFDELVELRNENYYENCCDKFIHIKTQFSEMIDDDDFYPLARFINDNIPEHHINWVNTFSIIQKENFAKIYRNDESEELETDIFKNIDDAINHDMPINEQIECPNFRAALEAGVREQLIQQQIINR